jgi:DNA-binding MarR family transcriptional regulator
MGKEKTDKVILNMSQQLKRALTATALSGDLSSIQVRILMFLYHCEKNSKKVFARDIEDEFRIRRSSVSSVLQNLEKNGLIERKQCLSDGRLKQVVLTDIGHETVAKHIDTMSKFEEKITAGISEEESAVFFTVMEKIHKNILDMVNEKDLN